MKCILEIIRYVLGIVLTEAVADRNYKNELVSYILGSGGKATLEFRGIDGKDYRIEKILDQTPSLYSNANERLDCSLNAVIDIPMYFGQKDLSNKKDSFESELINRMIGSHLDDHRRVVKEQEQNVRNCLIELQKLESATDRIPELGKTIKDAQQKLTFYKENGVEEKLRIQTQYEHDVNTLNKKIGKVIEFKFLQFMKAALPTYFNVAGKITVFNFLQLLNAFSPIASKPSPKTTFSKFSQPENAFAFI